MLLTTVDIFRPIATVSILVVEQTADTKLLGGSSIPAGPVAGARGLVSENAVQPVAVFRRQGSIWKGY